MSENSDPSALLARLQATLSAMPPVAAMDIRIAGYDNGVLRMHAPLLANVNDKGNAFGGSLASVMTLSGWALVSLRLAMAGKEAEVYVADSNLRYLAPVYEDLHAHAEATASGAWDTFLATFRQRGKARAARDRHRTAETAGGAGKLGPHAHHPGIRIRQQDAVPQSH
ncbi:putative thioesterase domain protein [compost metagenome]